jgi:TPR repeat protein
MAGQLGRVQVGGTDRGAGFALGPRLVVTANHVVREHGDTPVVYVPSGSEPIAVERVQHDIPHDAAILWLVSEVGEFLPASAAERGAEWRVESPPTDTNDPELHGTVSTARMAIRNARGHRVEVVQLQVSEDLGEFGGYSGSAVLDSLGRAALALLVEQKPLRTAAALGEKKPASNVLYAVPIGDVVTALGLPVQICKPPTAYEITDLVELVHDSDLPIVQNLDPYWLGATKSLVGDSNSYGVADRYVARTAGRVDDLLDSAIRAALQGGPMVMLVGPSKAGKTRTAFEALRRLLPQERLAAPKPGMLTRLATHQRWQTSTDPIVVWLDDLNLFFTHADPLTQSLLIALKHRPGPVMVIATLRSEERERLRQGGELTRDLRILFEQANEIALRPTSDDPDETEAARAAYPNVRLNAGLGAELAGAPQLLEQYDAAQHTDSIRRGVVEVVIDWARAGRADPVPEPVLTSLAHDLLFDRWPHLDVHDADIEAAIKNARTPPPGLGPVAMLHTHGLPGRVRGYRPFDYLLSADDGQNHHAQRPIPDWFWDRATQNATPDELFGVGVAAFQRGHREEAVRAFQLAAAGGQTDAMHALGLLDLPHRPESARGWLEMAAAGGHPDAMYTLGALDVSNLDLSTVRRWWEKAAAAGHPDAMLNLGDLLADQWDPPDLPAARSWYEKAAADGNTNAMTSLGLLLADQWDPPDLPAARSWYEKAAADGNTAAMTSLGLLLAKRWDPPDLPAARSWYEKAAADGNTAAMNNLGLLLAKRWDPPDLTGARSWYEKAVAAGDTNAMNNLGVLLAELWDPPDLPAARKLWEKAADAVGHTDAMNNLGRLLVELWDPPDLPAARSWYEKAADAGHTDAMYSLGVLLAYLWVPPDRPTARAYAMEAAAAGNIKGLALLVRLSD